MAEKTYIVPLRREYLKAPYYERSKRAMSALRAFLIRHLKTEDVLIGPKLNHMIWNNGIKNPPHKVKVSCVVDKGVAKVELFGHTYPEPIKPVEKAPETMKEKVQAALKKPSENAEHAAKSESTAKAEESKAHSKVEKTAEKQKTDSNAKPASKPAPKPTSKPAASAEK